MYTLQKIAPLQKFQAITQSQTKFKEKVWKLTYLEAYQRMYRSDKSSKWIQVQASYKWHAEHKTFWYELYVSKLTNHWIYTQPIITISSSTNKRFINIKDRYVYTSTDRSFSNYYKSKKKQLKLDFTL